MVNCYCICCFALQLLSTFTSDKHVSRVCVKAGLGVDTQGVHSLIFLVEVDKSERGTFPGPVGVYPFRGLQGLSWWDTSKQKRRDTQQISYKWTQGAFYILLVYSQFLYHTTSGWYFFTVGKTMTVQPRLIVSPSWPKATSNLSMMVVLKVTPCSEQKPSVEMKETCNIKNTAIKSSYGLMKSGQQ